MQHLTQALADLNLIPIHHNSLPILIFKLC